MSNFLRQLFKRLTTSKSRPSHFLRPPQLTYLETRINPAPLTTTFTVSNLNSSGAGSLAEAIGFANDTVNYPTNDTIVFASSLFTNGPATISLTVVLPAIADATTAGTLTITGPGANTLNISGNNGNFSVFSVATGGFLFISGVTVSGANFTSGFGGAFNNAGVLTISTSTISGNSASGGGGIFNQGTSLTISGSTISGNSTSGFGGGINNYNGGTISIFNSTISGNSATNGGGGIVNTNSNLTISNSTLFGNTTPGVGGGILNTTVSSGSSILNVTNSTLSGNSAGNSNLAGNNGGGIRNYATINNLSNTIIANSVRGGDFVGNAPAVSTNNLITTGALTGATTVTSAQINLGPLQDNGGPTFTMALGAGSVAIKTAAGTGTDQRGINRTTADIGAYSFGIQVTNTTDNLASPSVGSLSSAINLANTTPGNDQISVNLTGANPYTITLAGALPNIINAASVIRDSNNQPIGTAGTVTITGLGASNLNISGNGGNFCIFSVATGGNLFISGVTVSGAQTSGNGGAFNNSGILTVSNSTISGNSASFGGGIWNSGTLTVTNSSISGNSATQNGGAIYNNSSGVLNISNSEISGNSASYGGGILTRGNLTISNSKLSANIANDGNGKGSGGGIRNEGALTILNSTLSGNTAYGGGGISNGSSLTISNSTFFDNSATFGGGIENFGGTFSLNNSTLSGNSAIQGVGRGGAIYNRGVGTISNSTLSGNSAIQPGGGIYNFTGSTLNIANTIIANSTSGGDYAGSGTVNLIGSATAANNLVTQTGSLVSAWATTKTSAEINLGPLQDNGGPTLTMALGAGSVAIGTTAGTGTDQRGINRTTADIGAYSFGIAVNTTSDATAIDGVTSLREAITQANNTPGNDGISFNLTGSNTITLASALPTIAKASFAGSVTINGLGVSLLTINGNSSGFNFFNIATGGNLFVSGMTVSGAVFTSGNGGAFNNLGSLTISASTITGNSALNGGAIINQGTSLVVENSIISNNTTAGYGGGINNYNGGTISILNSTISGNSATNGGGGIINTNSNLTITDSVFTGNLSATNNGAGVLNTNANSFLTVSGSTFSNNTARNGGALFNNGTATINSSTISGNINAVKGAGIYNDITGVLTITDSTISNNASTGNGGGIFNKGSSLNISNSTISGNTSTANGGGVSNNSAGPVTISYSMISSNSAASGAGIFNLGTALTISNSTISGNSASGFGGGINNYKCYTNTISVSNSTISNNSANLGGGGIINTNSSLSVSNSTIYGNTTLGNGGGILNFSGSSTLSVTNSTLSGNSALSGGGIQNNATLNNLANTIIANSLSGGDFAGNAPNTNTNNLVETLGTVTGAFIPAFTADPRLGPLQDNGGPTFTMALGAGSPAIITAAGTGTDQRGINRITNDIGAYSFGIAVTNTTDNLTSPSVGSLRAAINLANTTPGNDQISVNLTGANPYTITLAGALPNIVAANTSVSGGTAGTVNITGLGASSLSIDGSLGGFSIFNIALGGDLSISGVTVSGANNFSGNGGAFNNFGTLAVSNSTISGNSANTGGGGFYNSGIATVTNSTISGNTAIFGGGILNGGTLTLTNSTLSGNSASINGGGILNNGTLNGGILTLTNSTLFGNTAIQSGGGINNNGILNIFNSTLSGNSAGQGGGIANSGTFNIANTIIANSLSGADFVGNAPTTNTNNLVETLGAVTGTFTPAFTADPLLGPLQNNGGPTFTMALLAGSPAISTTALVTPNLDQRGFTRSNNDIGAYAYFAPSAAGAIVVAVNTSGQVGLFLSSAGTAITDFHTAFAGSTLTITATRTTGTITGSGTGITIDNTAKTISVNLTLLSVFSGIVIEGNSGADSVTIGVGGVDFSVVTGGGTDQSLVITTGTGADSLTISNAINTKGNSAFAYLNSGSISGAGLVTTPTITLVANTGINVSASALAFANISTASGNIDITNTTGINLPAIAAPANLSINAGGTISQNGLITVVGLATFNAGANPITLTNPSNNFTGAVSLTNTGANNVSIRDVNTINFAASSLGNGTLSVNAVGITQTGAITQVANAGAVTFNAGAGVITLANVGNDFTGLVSLNNSGNNNVSVQDSTDLPIGLSNLGSGTLNLNAGSSGSIKIASNVTSLNGVQNYNSPIILTSNIDLNAGTGSINLPNMISGNFSLTPITANPGLTTISGANTNTTTNVTTGVVQISNTQSTNYVVSGGTLKGTGAIGSLTATGTGIIAPGNSPGKVTSTSLSLSSTNTLQIEIQGASSTPVSGTDYDQIVVGSTGPVNLGGAILTLSTTYTGNAGTVFTIIDNQGSSAISGTFNGLAEGAAVLVNGRAYQISYTGGNGNDVTLTVYDPATVTSFTPTIGKTGTPVVITGSNFTNVSQVSFNGTVQPTYTVNSPTQITTTVPSGATTGTISITTIAGTATSSSSITIDNTAPTLNISASPGSLKANETSTITFTFSEVVTGFSSSIITVTNGTLSTPVASNSTVYTAVFTPTLGIKADGTVSVSNNYFDSVGNQGTAATLTPPIAINTIQTPLVTGSASTSQNGASVVSLIDPDTGAVIGSAVPFPGFTGELRVVSGDFNNDGKVDIIAAAGPGGGPAIAVLDSQTGEVLQSFFAFDQAFTGGVFIAVRDFNGDGILDIIAGAGAGGGPEVRIFNGDGLTIIRSFFAYAQDFTGGVTVASIDFNNDGILDLVTGAGPGGAPHVKVFDGVTSSILSQWYAYPASFTGGVFVAAGDIGNDGNIEVVTGAGTGGAPVVAVWDPYTGALLAQFMAYAEDFSGGVRVGVSDGNFDGILDLVTGAGPGGGPQVNGFSFPTLDLLFSFFSGDPTNTDGVFVS